jgi:hypothetical protein
MTSNIKIPKLNKDNKVAESGFRNLIGRRMSKNWKFMNEEVKINKLSVEQVLEIQELANKVEGNNTQGFELLKRVIKMSAEGSEDLSDDDFAKFPMDELTKLSNEIMKYSGLGGEAGKS